MSQILWQFLGRMVQSVSCIGIGLLSCTEDEVLECGDVIVDILDFSFDLLSVVLDVFASGILIG